MIGQGKLICSPLEKALEREIKTIEDQRKIQIKALEKHGKQLIMSSSEKGSVALLKQK